MGNVLSSAVSAAVSAAPFLLAGNPAGAAIAFGVAFVGSAISAALAPKPPEFSFDATIRNRTQTIRQAITTRRVVVGEAQVGTVLTYYEPTDNNRYQHMVLVLCDGPVAAIDTVWIDGTAVGTDQLDGDGNVTAGKYSGKVRIKKHLGSLSATADADLVAECSVDSTFKGVGVAYLYLRADFSDRGLWPQGLPSVKASVRGATFEDPRDSTTRYTENAAIVARGYLTDATWGLGLAAADVDAALAQAAANTAEEMVAVKAGLTHTVDTVDHASDALDLAGDKLKFLRGDAVQLSSTGTLPTGIAAATDYYVVPVRERATVTIGLATTYANAIAGTADRSFSDAGTGTITVEKTKEPRYTVSGVIDTAQTPREIVGALAGAMGGFVTRVGPTWSLIAGGYTAPTVTLGDDEIRKITVRPRLPRRDRFNGIHGEYVSPINDGQATDYPVVSSSLFETNDQSEQVLRNVNFPLTARPATCQRLAWAILKQARSDEITASVTTTLAGLQVAPGDTVQITNDRRGWSAKVFLVTGLRVTAPTDRGGTPYLAVELDLAATSSSVWSYTASSDEQTVEPADEPATADLANPAAPTALVLTSDGTTGFLKADGTFVGRIHAAWTESVDAFADRYAVQYKKTAAATWQDAAPVPHGFDAQQFVWDVEDGTGYDVRVRTVTRYGASSWLTGSVTAAGKSAAPSDVASLSAQQNGAVVTFRWSKIADLDRADYELRFMPATSTFAWDDATFLTRETKGTLVTNAGLPPGAWTVGIKARDTSGNYSTNATTTAITVTNANDVVLATVEAPRWAGTRTDCLVHAVSGCLVPDSTSLASAPGWDVFDSFTPDPVASFSYETPVADLGADFTDTRAWASTTAALGPGESGDADPQLAIDYRLAAGSFDGYEDWTVGTIAARYAKMRATIDTASGVAMLCAMTPTYDVPERSERFAAQTVAVAGTAIAFATRFHTVPAITVTPAGGAATPRFGVYENATTTGVTVFVFDETGADTGGTADVTATGA